MLVSSLPEFFALVEAIMTTTLVCHKRSARAHIVDFYCRFAFLPAIAVVTAAT